MTKKFLLVTLIVVVVLLVVACNNKAASEPGSLLNPFTWGDEVLTQVYVAPGASFWTDPSESAKLVFLGTGKWMGPFRLTGRSADGQHVTIDAVQGWLRTTDVSGSSGPESILTAKQIEKITVVDNRFEVAVATAAPQPSPTAIPLPSAAVVPTKVPTLAPAKAPTAKANRVVPKTNGATLNVASLTAQSTQQQGGWTIQYYDGATGQMKSWQFADLVKDWDKYPNLDMPKYQFQAKDGVEYGMAESAYCQRAKTCDINIPAMHYRLISGDYNIPGIDNCVIDTAGAGCAIMLVNVGTVTAMYRESSVDYGFTVEGRYWNGDAMPTTVRALLSSTVYNMMTANTVNQGANCSVPTGCQRLRMTFAITSGNQLLVKGTEIVSR